MADRDTSGTGGPNHKASDPMARNQTGIGQTGMGHNNSTDRMSSDISRMTDEATEAGRDTISSAQGRIRSLLEQQSHRAADQLGSVANALHKAAEQLSEENNGTAAHYAGQAADRVEQVADMLRNSTVDDMVSQVEGFARRQPEVFVGAAFAVGFLFARFIKSSGERRFQGQGTSRLSSSGTMGSGNMGSGTMGSRSTGRWGQEERGYGRSSMGSGMDSDTRRGMAGGLAGSTSMSSSSMGSAGDRARQGNYATAGAAPPRSSLNAATAATSAARTRDAAQLMAGGSPEPTPASTSDIGTAKPNQGKPSSNMGATVGATTGGNAGTTSTGTPLSAAPSSGGKPQGSSS
ncbi:hypothetical protein [Azospirillum sp. sgz302134]